MTREELLRHKDRIQFLYDQYNAAFCSITLDNFASYLLDQDNVELKEFVLEKSGSGDHSAYLDEIFGHKYFIRDIPRILNYIETEIERLEDTDTI